ncbi:MAG: DNA internalization-related competence protein ComEC/Rec2 [Planctomycetales bacterium]|nr:DNA internalization-related competence protein ComEC/Rec2 [Planctomycetales bacterium]
MKRRSFDESDLIRLNLEQLDAQTRQPPLPERLFSEVPLMPFAAAFLIGILFVNGTDLSFRLLGITLGGVLLTAAVCFGLSFKTTASVRLILMLSCSCMLFFALAAVRYYSILAIPPDHISHYLDDRPRELATLRGKVISPVLTTNLPARSSIPWLEPKSSFYLKTTEVKTVRGWQKTSGTVRVQTAEPIHHVRPGNTVMIYCWLSRFEPPANPGQFDLSNHMRQRGIHLAAAVESRDGIDVIRDSRSIVFGLRSLLYRFASAALLDETAAEPDVRSLVSTLLLGIRSDLDPVLVSAFQKTNLAHHISLSGMHVAILAGSLWLVLRTAQVPKRPRAILCIILILTYAMIVPPRAATLRAVVMSCFFFASATVYRRVHPLNTLALSAIAMLFVRPYELFDAGWQLSFMSVFGILVFHKPAHYLLLNRLFFPLVPLFRGRFILVQHFLYYIIDALAVGMGAWIAIAPILLYYFGLVNPWSPLWTVLTSAPILVMLYAGFLKMAIAPLLPTLASVLGVLLAFCSILLEKMVLALAKIDFLQTPSCRPPLAVIFILYGLMITAYFIPCRYGRLRKILLLLLIAGLFFPRIIRVTDGTNKPAAEMTCLSVGHGQAIVLSMPGGKHILFDGGSITHQDIARKIIAPYLLHRSIFALDAVYISHGDLDHINAVSEIAASVPIKAIYANHVFIESAQKPSIEKELCDRLKQLCHPLAPVDDYYNSEGLTITSLWPTEPTTASPPFSENDKSEVLLIEYAGRKILLCGDIETYAQKKLLEALPELSVDVLVLPHHGSTTNLIPAFVEHFKPAAAIASCAANRVKNAYHPPAASNMKVFYTAVDGAVTIKIKADGTLSADGFLNSQN